MTTAAVPPVGAPPALAKQWEALDWASLHRQVQRLQVRIAKAVKEKRYGKARALQWLLTHSFAAKALAVRRVTNNRGKYFRSDRGRQWIFTARARNVDGTGTNVDLFRASSLRIRRHIKIRAEATTFDPEFASYFEKRKQEKHSRARNRSVVQPAF